MGRCLFIRRTLALTLFLSLIATAIPNPVIAQELAPEVARSFQELATRVEPGTEVSVIDRAGSEIIGDPVHQGIAPQAPRERLPAPERSKRRSTSRNWARGEVTRSQYPRVTARRLSSPWSRVRSTRPAAAMLPSSASSTSFR